LIDQRIQEFNIIEQLKIENLTEYLIIYVRTIESNYLIKDE